MKSPKLIPAVSTKNMGNKDKAGVLADGTRKPLLEAISEAVGDCPKGVIDLTAGSLAVTLHLNSECGQRVIANDCRKAPFYFGQAIFSRDGVHCSDEDVALLQQGDLVAGPMTTLHGAVLGKENASHFDRIIRNLGRLAGDGAEQKRIIVVAGILQAISGALNIYHLRGANRDTGAAGNEHLRDADLISKWRDWVLVEHPKIAGRITPGCEMHNEDAVLLMQGKRPSASCLYLDMPYGTGNYPADLKVFEDICHVCEGKKPGDPIFGHPAQPVHRFDNRIDFIGNLTKLLLLSAHIPRWVISINTSSPVRPEEIARIARSMGRSCEIRRYRVPLRTNRRRTRPDDNHECLVVCVPDVGLENQIRAMRQTISALAKKTLGGDGHAA